MGSDKKFTDEEEKRRKKRSRKRSSSSDTEDEGKSRTMRERDDERERRSRKNDKAEKRKGKKSHKHHHGKEKKSKDKRKIKHHNGGHQLKPHFKELTDDDYYSKNNEFATWLKEERKVFFSDLSSESARELFVEFVKDWNDQKLEDQYYEGISTGPRSAHNWNLKI
ncbi:hypothetical protein K2173_004569 [Erythroxylum novogranatense]|uniref:Uncharacterized protein n=1 Tax=Erythroxylum novogranatense TaxID=1862640 RepID=A0AAV8T6P6_9ROSI|nr:hypothetical protein K2173_004569 [Erythroxylum novogranatense]